MTPFTAKQGFHTPEKFTLEMYSELPFFGRPELWPSETLKYQVALNSLGWPRDILVLHKGHTGRLEEPCQILLLNPVSQICRMYHHLGFS